MAARDLLRRQDLVTQPEERSLGELLSGVTHDLGLLVRQEIELAKAEMRDKVKKLATGAIAVAIGGALAYAGLLTLIAAWALGLVRLGAPAWAAVLAIAVVIVIVGGALIRRGVNAFSHADPVPRRAAESLKHSLERVKEQIT